jgi:isopentenyl diphosphate isomerase/L-lactate dehydrogenase-like FMN-dependent dehydrogenase
MIRYTYQTDTSPAARQRSTTAQRLTTRQDMRTKFEGNASAHQTKGSDKVQRDQGAARAISSFIDPSLNWTDLAELVEAAKGMKVILKGVQCWEVS